MMRPPLAVVFCMVVGVVVVGPSMAALPTSDQKLETETTASLDTPARRARRLRSRLPNERNAEPESKPMPTDIPQDLLQLQEERSSNSLGENTAVNPIRTENPNPNANDGARARARAGQAVLQVCRRTTLNFARAANGRDLHGGEFVMGEWFHRYGVHISAEGHDGDHNLHPMIFDSSSVERNGLLAGSKDVFALGSPNFECGGFGQGRGGREGSPGENCQHLGNLLLPSRKPGSPTPTANNEEGGSSRSSSQGGVLVFEFSKLTKVRNIDLLNVGEEDQVIVVRSDGSVNMIDLVPKGQNGFQSVPVDLDQVQQLFVTFHSFAAVAALDLCVVRDR
eukprot:jgi/Psemu1/287094/fgenesh1_pg.175_\